MLSALPAGIRLGPALMLILGLAGCGRDATPPSKTPATSVEAVRVEAADGAAALSATGALERRREITLAFRIPGVLTQVAAEAGDVVTAGQVLARVDPTAVDAGERRAAAEAEQARRDLERDRALAAKGFVSRQRLDDRLSAVKTAEAGLAAAAFDRRWARLVSPASGVVLERLAQSGEVVQPGQAVVRLADAASPLVLRAPLSDREVARVRLGDAVRITTDAASGPYAGRVTRIGQEVSAQTGVVEVEIEIAGGADLRSGQIVTAEIAAASVASGLTRLPAEAILEADGRRAFVLTVDGKSVARRREVAFGGFDGDDALVGGLPGGVRVITAGAGFVVDGEAVRVVDPARPAAG